jgi:adenosylhomocysteine nucleosidase
MPAATKPKSDPKVDVAIVCALELEAASMVRRLGGRQKTIGNGFTIVTGWCSQRRVAVLRSDVGRKRLLSAADAMLAVHRPNWLISAGFAVGIDECLKRGDFVAATELVDEDNTIVPTDLQRTVLATAARGLVPGRIVSISPLPRAAAEKCALKKHSRAIAADAHSWSLAKISADHGVRYVPIRIVVDAATTNAEPESRAVYHPSATFRAGGVVGAFMSGSGRVGKIWKMRATAKQHAERLALFVARVIPTLA